VTVQIVGVPPAERCGGRWGALQVPGLRLRAGIAAGP
jgi:hypothetical protein